MPVRAVDGLQPFAHLRARRVAQIFQYAYRFTPARSGAVQPALVEVGLTEIAQRECLDVACTARSARLKRTLTVRDRQLGTPQMGIRGCQDSKDARLAWSIV